MARNYKNWIDGFVDWVKPRSESPASFLELTALFAIACAVRKHVKIPRTSGLGGWECYPNIYTVLVGEPGVVRKTTTMDFADELLKDLTNSPSAPTFMTQASLMQTISESPDGSIYITASELGSLIQKSKTDMFEFLTDGYDTRKAIRGRTILRGHEVIENPCINMMACTQPGWMQENMPASVITGGFASRTIFAFESEPRVRELFYDGVNYEELEPKRVKLLEDLEHLSTLRGEFTFADEAKSWASNWYKTTLAEQQRTCDHRLKGYYGRKHVHLLKFAMLYSLSRCDELILELRDMTQAYTLLERIEKNIPRIFERLGKNEFVNELDAIRAFIRENERVPLNAIYERFEGAAEPQKLQALVQFFVLKGEVTVETEGNELWYRYIGLTAGFV